MVSAIQVFSQGKNWKLGANDNVNDSCKIGSINNADVKIVTNDTTRINVGKDGTTEFFGKVKMSVDSLKVNGFIQADNIRIKGALHIGDSSMVLNGVPLGGPGASYDQITSSYGKLNFGNSGATFSDIKLGVGTTTTITDVGLNVVNDINVDVNKSYRIGGTSVLSNKGTSNIFVGENAGNSISTGIWNAFVGDNAGFKNESGGANSYLGNQAGYNNINGSHNSFVGYMSGYNTSGNNSNGSWNSFFGSYSGYTNTSGLRNSFFGNSTGYKNTIGTDNSFFGAEAGYGNTEGISNSFIGNSAGNSNTTGSYNSFVGYMAVSSNNYGNGTSH